MHEHQPESGDLEILELLATFGHLLSSQIHRRINRGRALTTTQRRLKRLADGGCVERLQLHRPDGGGVPICYSLGTAGHLALEAAGAPATPSSGSGPRHDLRRIHHELRVAGWVLALGALRETSEVRGESASTIVAPRSPSSSRAPLTLAELRLPGGRVPHDFHRTLPSGDRAEVERFDTLRAHATVTLSGGDGSGLDLLVERDDRCGSVQWDCKLERYDHFLTGWSTHTNRYGPRGRCEAAVVFVCRDRARAIECARRADGILLACRAYAGDYPHSWEHTGRQRVFFAGERDVHEGLLVVWAPLELPPALRAPLAREGEGAGGAAPVRVTELPRCSTA
jgi:hypothetical protein